MHVARYPVVPLRRLSPRRGLRREWLFGAALLATDMAAFSLLYLGCLTGRQFLRFEGWSLAANLSPLLVCLAALAFVFAATSRYTLAQDIQSVRFAAEHALACVGALGLALLLQFSVFLFDFSRSRLALLAAFAAFTPVTLLIRRVLGRAFCTGMERRSILVLGAGAEAVELYRACVAHGLPRFLRFVDFGARPEKENIDGPGSPRIEAGSWDDFTRLLDGEVEVVVAAGLFPARPWPGIDGLVRIHFYHVPILTLEAFHERYWRKIPVGRMDLLWALRQDFRLARDSSYRFFKRGLDILVSVIGLLVLGPVLLLCALAVKWSDGGAVLYCQPRIRRDREIFRLFKFRTLREGEADPTLYTCEEDRRITRTGRWMRRLRLDELPQLWNVLRGEMSLIGPRAEWTRCVERYEREIPGYHLRHLVKPGITGWAQVNYPYGRSVEDAVEKLTYDLYYIKNYSLLLDAAIVLKTFYVILSCKGK